MLKVKITFLRSEYASLVEWLDRYEPAWQYPYFYDMSEPKATDGRNERTERNQKFCDQVGIGINDGQSELEFVLARETAMLARLSWTVVELEDLSS